MKRQFQLNAQLAAYVDDMKHVGLIGNDLITIPGNFSHPIHGPFEMGFIGDPPKLVVLHSRTRMIGWVECQPMLEVLAQELVKKIHG